MIEVVIKGVSVQFPFKPYDIQINYMEKVIECLQNEYNGVLESPTGTGKTLCLLCSVLGWLQMKKAHLQAQRQMQGTDDNFLKTLQAALDANVGKSSGVKSSRSFLGLPTIIYASRTHSQLSQCMQELKRTAYSHMKACVLASRDQLCIHPEVVKEKDTAMKIHHCRLKVKTRSCHFNNRVERLKDDAIINNCTIVDIEDIVKLGETHKFCPYYMSKELKQEADIVFMPYNYLIDPRVRKALGVELQNTIVILDEAHNVEKMCEDSASLQIKSTDIALCIEEMTAVMKLMSEDTAGFNDTDIPKDFNCEDLCLLKQMFLDFEKELDTVQVKNDSEGSSFGGDFLFELLNKAGISDSNGNIVISLLEKITQFLSTLSGDGPFQRKGGGLQLFEDMLRVVFLRSGPDHKEKVKQCYRVHIKVEEPKRKSSSNWLSKSTVKAACRVLSYWCLSPGFGMDMLMEQGVKCVILTSGTLAPLKPFISELGLNAQVSLENPHIVKSEQVCVKIVPKGPDGELLNCSFLNRDNPKYINSLGQTILNISRLVPHGLLIFFPSYPLMQKFQQSWQETGLWDNICKQKQVYVEPKDKSAFATVMAEYYSRIQDPNLKGAIFMAVCRGKVSEGLDFADMNGRAVIVVGLPFPPMKDPRVILKKQYLDICKARDKEYLSGAEWYSLEATRAVNQAIGRVIRHRYDYGAILLLDSRFNNYNVYSKMSAWIKGRISVVNNFGEIIRDMRNFFRNAEATIPKLKSEPVITEQASTAPSACQITNTYHKGNFNFSATSVESTSTPLSSQNLDGLVNIQRTKKRKITLIPDASTKSHIIPETTTKEYIVMVKKALDEEPFKKFLSALSLYKNTTDFDKLTQELDEIFLTKPQLRYIIQGLEPYIKDKSHKERFNLYWEKMNLT